MTIPPNTRPIPPSMTIRDLVARSHGTSREKGWWPGEDLARGKGIVPEKIALMHSELSEALEAYRNNEPLGMYTKDGKPEGVAVELADCVIRIADLCGFLGLDLDAALEAKMAYNQTREHRHGGKVC